MPPGDWKQWAKDRPQCIYENIEEAFCRFVDQRWTDLLNLVATESAYVD
jgi:5-methylthioribose kinase